jgi:hypothetical protein
MFEFSHAVLAMMRDGLAECVQSERTAPNIFSASPVVGMFRVRRTVEISEKLQQVVQAILDGQNDIRLDGIRIVVPTTRRHVFEPALPVFVTMMGTELNVSVASLELIEDSGQPAILVTTESSLKPDLVLVLSVLPNVAPEDREQKLRIADMTDRLLLDLQVPKQHHEQTREATRHAWVHGIAQDVAGTMLPKTGRFASPPQLKAAAREIVQQLADQQVIQMGWFFWARLGYWLVKIVMALLEEQQVHETRVWLKSQKPGEYQGQSTVIKHSGR